MAKKQYRTHGRAALVAIPAVGALLLAGCSGTDDAPAADGDGAVEFSMAYATSNTLESPFEVLAERYMEANDHVTISLEPAPNDSYGDTLRAQLQAGNAPDVIQTEVGGGQTRSIVPLSEAGFLEPLGDTSAALVPDGDEALYGEGGVYGQPLMLAFSGLIYNQTAATGAGVDEFPTDWAGVEALCADMRDQGKTAFLMAGATVPNTGMTTMNIAATRVYGENPTWNQDRLDGETTFVDSEGWRDTLETIVAMNEAGCFQDGAVGAGFDVLTNNLTTGAGLGFFGPLGSASELKQAAPDQEFVAQAFPPAEEGDPVVGIASPTYALSVNAKSEQKEAALEFLDWLAEPEQANLFAEISGHIPITGSEEFLAADPVYAPVADLITSGDFIGLPNQQWPNPSVYETLASGVQGLFTGQTTVDSVLESLDAAWEQ